MIALREGAKELNHEHFHGGILEVAAKKKSDHFVSLVPCCVVDSVLIIVVFSTLLKRLGSHTIVSSRILIDVITSVMWTQCFGLYMRLSIVRPLGKHCGCRSLPVREFRGRATFPCVAPCDCAWLASCLSRNHLAEVTSPVCFIPTKQVNKLSKALSSSRELVRTTIPAC